MERLSGRGAHSLQAPARLTRTLRVLAAAVALALIPTLSEISPARSAVVADYPSWSDVVAARNNEANAKALSASLQAQLQGLQEEAQRTQQEADAKGVLYAEAQDAYDAQKLETESLIAQTAEAETQAADAYAVAARIIAEMSKSGSLTDLTPQLFTTPGSPDMLLQRLEMNRVVGDRYAGLYAEAVQLRNRAKALASQAEIAQGLLDELRIKAEAALQAAVAAAEAAAAQLAKTERDIAELRARVEYLAGVRQQTTADYNAGIQAQWGGGAAGEISQSGWTRPISGYISSPYGWRINPVTFKRQFHTGVDLAGNSCGTTIRAARAGVVTYAGWSGSWGYYVAINHGDGTGTGYAHIQAGGIGVSVGQQVAPGQPIAKVGSTGQSTGCHLQFNVRVNGDRDITDPVQFMREQGIVLG